MPVDILLTVIVTSIIQSVFGVGVLLFGTPLLLLGYDFIDALIVLLPISIAINALQILKHHQYIDFAFYRNVLIYTIPFVVLFLFIVTTANINIGFLVGLFLVFVALKNVSSAIEAALDALLKHERIYLAVMGIVHGLTNLGGIIADRHRAWQALPEKRDPGDGRNLLCDICPVPDHHPDHAAAGLCCFLC